VKFKEGIELKTGNFISNCSAKQGTV